MGTLRTVLVGTLHGELGEGELREQWEYRRTGRRTKGTVGTLEN
jgi:hypothetical protein